MSDELPLTKVCEFVECGQTFSQGHRTNYRWERMRFCSQDCGRRGTAAGPARGEFCRSGMHVMAGDNVRLDSRGKRSCRACQAARKAGEPSEPSEFADDEPRPIWRPAAWAELPNVRDPQ